MLPRDEAFLADICEHPADDAPRLIYADWLEEHGDEEGRDRAHFIRVQIEAAKLPASDPRKAELGGQAHRLLSEREGVWRARLPRLRGVNWHRFWRGFVSGADVGSWKFYRRQARELFEATPVQFLRILSLGVPTCEQLAGSPYLSRLQGLELGGNHIGDAGARALASCPFLANLRALGLRGLAARESSFLPRFGRPQFGDAGACALAASPHLGGLLLLDLRFNTFSDRAAQWLRDRFGDRVWL
jgi:uncharacterized protein (TIGR02996 family)